MLPFFFFAWKQCFPRPVAHARPLVIASFFMSVIIALWSRVGHRTVHSVWWSSDCCSILELRNSSRLSSGILEHAAQSVAGSATLVDARPAVRSWRIISPTPPRLTQLDISAESGASALIRHIVVDGWSRCSRWPLGTNTARASSIFQVERNCLLLLGTQLDTTENFICR